MSALKPTRYYLTQLEFEVMDDSSEHTTIYRTLSKDDVTILKDIGEAPYKKFIKRERRVISKSDLANYPPFVDIEVFLDEELLSEKSLLDDSWFQELVHNSSIGKN